MNIELLAAGTKPPAFVTEGFGEYAKRLPNHWQLRVREVPVARRTKNTGIASLTAEEASRMLEAIKPGARIVALDSAGDPWSTPELAAKLEDWRQNYPLVQIMIGGPDGLDRRCIDRADDTWSLSRLTFPHFVVRLILAEQIYRAWTIINNHPYHK